MARIQFGSVQADAVRNADKRKAAQDALPEYHTALLATCRICGGVVGISINEPRRVREVARDAAEWIRAGLCVRDLPVDEAKANLKNNWCECGRSDTQTTPFLSGLS